MPKIEIIHLARSNNWPSLLFTF